MKLGDRVRDVFTGFSGVLVARTEWLNGPIQLTIESTQLYRGKPIGRQTFDEVRLEFWNEDE